VTLLVLVLVFSIVVGDIEDCAFDGLKLGSERKQHSCDLEQQSAKVRRQYW